MELRSPDALENSRMVTRWMVLAALATPQEAPSEGALAGEAAATSGALPEDLRRSLENRLRVLDVAAHPDDEDNGLLLTFALQGAETSVVYATSGDGGQNAIGPEIDAALGALRQQEVLAAQRVTGATPSFLGFLDFGYSKRADEAFQRWGGQEEVVRRLVRTLRELRPHRIFTNHPQTGGHGHHQAVSIALHEAVVAAADPARFPEQIDEGLAPWRADALFVRWFQPPDKDGKPAEPPELSVPLDYDLPATGSDKTIAQLAREALLRHASQGPWSAFDPKAKHAARYVITWSAGDVRDPALLPPHRLTLPPTIEAKPFTLEDLLALLESDAMRGDDAPSPAQRDAWLRALLGADLFFPDEDPLHPRAALAPGESVPLFVILHGRDELYRGRECAESVRRHVGAVSIEGPATLSGGDALAPFLADPAIREIWRDALAATLLVDVRSDAVPARWPFPLAVRIALDGSADGGRTHALRIPIEKAIEPPAIAELSPSPLALVRDHASAGVPCTLRVRFPTGRVPTAPVRVRAPDGFDFVGRDARGNPRTTRSLPWTFDAEHNLGTSVEPRFELPLVLRPIRSAPRATSETGAQDAIARIVLPIRFEDGASVADAAGAVAWIDARTTKGVRVGFVPGADGSIGDALRTLGVDCRPIAPESLAAADLDQLTTLVLDVRSLGSSPELREQAPRLREWIARGGHVVSLYHKTAEWNPWAKEEKTPSPLRLELTDKRVCEEDAPVRILAPAHALLQQPNAIVTADFDGWTQERALYVPFESYDPAFTELLSCSDRDEPALLGTLLAWNSPGGGSFTWCALALHRQLRAGHAGAFRLLANLVGRTAPPGH